MIQVLAPAPKYANLKFQINTITLKTQTIQMMVNLNRMFPKLLKITITFHTTNALLYGRHKDVSLFLNIIIHYKSVVTFLKLKFVRE